MMDRDLKELLLPLNAPEVEHRIAGGYTVGAHSEPRATKDLDIFIGTNTANSVAVCRAWADLGAPLQGMTRDDFQNDPDHIFEIGVAPNRVDILTEY